VEENMKKKIILGITAVVIFLLGVIGGKIYCKFNNLNITVSSDKGDLDFSEFESVAIVEEEFTINVDVRVFTLYAFLNSVGGFENDRITMTPERQRLTSDMEKRLEKVDSKIIKEWKRFYKSEHIHHYGELYYVLTLGKPSEFNFIVSEEDIDEKYPFVFLKGLNNILGEFYEKCDIGKLYKTYAEEELFRSVKEYNPQEIKNDMILMYDYVRIPKDKARDIDMVIVPNPFDQHYSAYSIKYKNTLYVVDGPGSNGTGLNFHEYLHLLINPLVEKNLKENKGEFKAVLNKNKSKSMVKGSYEEVKTYVSECLVRALDHRITIKKDKELEYRIKENEIREIGEGLVLIEYFNRLLLDFEKDEDMSIEDFIIDAIKNFDSDNM